MCNTNDVAHCAKCHYRATTSNAEQHIVEWFFFCTKLKSFQLRNMRQHSSVNLIPATTIHLIGNTRLASGNILHCHVIQMARWNHLMNTCTPEQLTHAHAHTHTRTHNEVVVTEESVESSVASLWLSCRIDIIALFLWIWIWRTNICCCVRRDWDKMQISIWLIVDQGFNAFSWLLPTYVRVSLHAIWSVWIITVNNYKGVKSVPGAYFKKLHNLFIKLANKLGVG